MSRDAGKLKTVEIKFNRVTIRKKTSDAEVKGNHHDGL
jgi:hypothetical protein